MNVVDLVRIARRHGIAIVPDDFNETNAIYVIARVEAMGGIDLRGLAEDPEVVEFQAHFADLATELRWLLDAGLIDSWGREERLDDAPPRELLDLDVLDGLTGPEAP